MAYKLVLPDGLVVEVDSATELQQAVQVLRPQPGLVPTALPSDVSLPLEIASFRAFMKGMPRKQRSIITCLVNAPDGVEDQALREAIGVKPNSNLGGAMAGLSKKAKAAGLTIDDILEKESWISGKRRRYRYTITNGLKTALGS